MYVLSTILLFKISSNIVQLLIYKFKQLESTYFKKHVSYTNYILRLTYL